jgi:hypothetical protein
MDSISKDCTLNHFTFETEAIDTRHNLQAQIVIRDHFSRFLHAHLWPAQTIGHDALTSIETIILDCFRRQKKLQEDMQLGKEESVLQHRQERRLGRRVAVGYSSSQYANDLLIRI